MKKIIITTTILPPTEAIEKYDAMPDWHLIVTGDRKSPKSYPLKRGQFLNLDYQQEFYPDLCSMVGPDSTARGRMIGMIEAFTQGADIIATIDDDNYPYEHWGRDIYIGKETLVPFWDCGICFDPLSIQFAEIWHRGFPLELVRKKPACKSSQKTITPLLQADFWDGDPDVDAMTRIVRAPNVKFKHMNPFSGGPYSPVNSQNTFIAGKYAADYCPFSHIGRHEDIWAGYVFQAYHPSSTIYGLATVEHRQDRSMSSLVRDLEDELYGYKNTLRLLKDLLDVGPEVALERCLPRGGYYAWKAYREYFK